MEYIPHSWLSGRKYDAGRGIPIRSIIVTAQTLTTDIYRW